ncbi:hypothetical protein AB395_00004180 [Sinorhizobium fredii CCBAU 45436]|nr:hypothetical protein SF83666_c39790 [Sinorhizobium fredii CCBAU 83666]AWI59804.1 hypothetical protein AB395_00004180 [Sinorhizobium fredii CCBAU 45436]AWM27429.1 hypothetical protein AOX55_00004208 [Sinorhizobium fredii CCBAU 25509]
MKCAIFVNMECLFEITFSLCRWRQRRKARHAKSINAFLPCSIGTSP